MIAVLIIAAVGLTLSVWELASRLHARSRSPWLNPVLISITTIIIALSVSGVSYADYHKGGHLVSFFLGPAVVALAVPLVRLIDKVRANLRAIVVSVCVGSLTGMVSAVGLALLLGGSQTLALSLAPKSVTTPIAIGVAEHIGGAPPLTAALVILTGILGAVAGPQLLRAVGVRSPFAWGLALGTAAHGIGTARAVADDPEAGATSGIGMALNGIITAFTLPYLVPPLLRLIAG